MPTFEEIAPTIASILTETEATQIAKDIVVTIEPQLVEEPTPVLTPEVISQALKYIEFLGVSFVPIEKDIWRNNGPKDIVEKVCRDFCNPMAINEQQVLDLFEEWKQFKSWKNSQNIEGNNGL